MILDEEHPKPRSPDQDPLQSEIDANICLAGIIGAFVFLTLIAYLLNEGKHLLVIPILRSLKPRCKWVLQYEKELKEKEEEKLNAKSKRDLYASSR